MGPPQAPEDFHPQVARQEESSSAVDAAQPHESAPENSQTPLASLVAAPAEVARELVAGQTRLLIFGQLTGGMRPRDPQYTCA